MLHPLSVNTRMQSVNEEVQMCEAMLSQLDQCIARSLPSPRKALPTLYYSWYVPDDEVAFGQKTGLSCIHNATLMAVPLAAALV